MQVGNKLIAHLEELSRLQLTADEREQVKLQLGQIIQQIDRLGQLPADKQSTACPTGDGYVLREDMVICRAAREQMLANAPQQKDDYFCVPKTVEQEER